ncbi:MAG TPA: DUF4397 domain-containing protein [Gemmatimonadaceae bacterium]|nr:DUF4397 domain-containing protein [Gemmatimonadaceae bacterium]
MNRYFLASLAAAAALACGTVDAPGPLEPGTTGRIRFVNLVTDPARVPVNAILESVPFGVNLGYGGTTPSSLPSPATANYSAVLVGDRTLVVQRTADPTVTLGTFTIPIVVDQDVTVYAIGGTGGSAVTTTSTVDDNTAPATGQVKLRVAHMSPTMGAVDVFITAAGADLTAATPVASGLAYKSASTYATVAPGSYVVRFVPAGTAAASRNAAVVLTSATTAVTANTGRTFVARDAAAGGAPLGVTVIADQ